MEKNSYQAEELLVVKYNQDIESVKKLPVTPIVKCVMESENTHDIDLTRFGHMMKYVLSSSKEDEQNEVLYFPKEHILKIIYEIRSSTESNITEKIKYFENLYNNEFKAYPIIFYKTSVDVEFDLNKLEYMLDMISHVKKKTISEYDASVKVGQQLYNEYVKL